MFNTTKMSTLSSLYLEVHQGAHVIITISLCLCVSVGNSRPFLLPPHNSPIPSALPLPFSLCLLPPPAPAQPPLAGYCWRCQTSLIYQQAIAAACQLPNVDVCTFTPSYLAPSLFVMCVPV